MPKLVVSYSGVHQAYQLALAAQEAELLDRFLCSFLDAPGKWGRQLSRAIGSEAFRSRCVPGLDSSKVIEHPWPELAFKLKQRFWGVPSNAWIGAARAFDRWAAKQLPKLNSRAVVCSENCAYESFQVAQGLGWKRIYDCPGHNAELWNQTTKEAARRCGLPFVSTADTAEVSACKEVEVELADMILCYSEFHADGIAKRGVSRDRINIIPLWADATFWRPAVEKMENRSIHAPLKVLFAGGINLRKGIPFLVEACRKMAPRVRLTLVGSLDPDVVPSLAGLSEFGVIHPPVSKERLRQIYQQHDVLVLPSLGDSFGFVGLEAMACGLPVVVTQNCGVPVPDESWRVPVMDAVSIAQRLELYATDRNHLAADGERAMAFAREFTPERYRRKIQQVYLSLLSNP